MITGVDYPHIHLGIILALLRGLIATASTVRTGMIRDSGLFDTWGIVILECFQSPR